MTDFLPIHKLQELNACGRCHAAARAQHSADGWSISCSKRCHQDMAAAVPTLAAAVNQWNRQAARSQAKIRRVFWPWWKRGAAFILKDLWLDSWDRLKRLVSRVI